MMKEGQERSIRQAGRQKKSKEHGMNGMNVETLNSNTLCVHRGGGEIQKDWCDLSRSNDDVRQQNDLSSPLYTRRVPN